MGHYCNTHLSAAIVKAIPNAVAEKVDVRIDATTEQRCMHPDSVCYAPGIFFMTYEYAAKKTEAKPEASESEKDAARKARREERKQSKKKESESSVPKEEESSKESASEEQVGEELEEESSSQEEAKVTAI